MVMGINTMKMYFKAMGQDKLTLGGFEYHFGRREWSPVLSPGIISNELGRTLGEWGDLQNSQDNKLFLRRHVYD